MTHLVAQMVKHLSAVRETWVQSLCWEDSLEKEMATQSSTLAQKIPWTEEPGVHGVAKSRTRLSDFTLLSLTLKIAQTSGHLSKFLCFFGANDRLLQNLRHQNLKHAHPNLIQCNQRISDFQIFGSDFESISGLFSIVSKHFMPVISFDVFGA